MTMPAAHRLLAVGFGRMMGRHDPESEASSELSEILQARLAMVAGAPLGSPAFEAIVRPVILLAVEIADDVLADLEARGEALEPMGATLDPALFVGLPVRRWQVAALDRADRVLDARVVPGRTTGEALRLARSTWAPAGAAGWTITGHREPCGRHCA